MKQNLNQDVDKTEISNDTSALIRNNIFIKDFDSFVEFIKKELEL